MLTLVEVLRSTTAHALGYRHEEVVEELQPHRIRTIVRRVLLAPAPGRGGG